MATAADAHPVPQSLVRKIGELPRERVAEVEDFVDFLSQRVRSAASDQPLRQATMIASAPSFARIWNNPEDDVYNDL